MTNNLMTCIVLGILLIIVFLIIRSLINDHKKGIHSSCGGDCGSCRAACLHSIKLPKKL